MAHKRISNCDYNSGSCQKPMESTQYLSLIEVLLENLREAVVVLDGNLRVKRASTAFYRIFQLLPEDAENQFIYELNDGGCAVPELIDLLEKIVSTKEIVKDLRIEHDFPGVGRKTLLLNVCPILDKEEAVQMILITCEEDLRSQISKVIVGSDSMLTGMKIEEYGLEEIYMKYFKES